MAVITRAKSNKTNRKLSQNKRLSQRIQLQTDASVMFNLEPQIKASIENISVSGLGLLSPVLALPKTECWVKFELPSPNNGTRMIEQKAIVIHGVYSPHHKQFKRGLKFMKPQPLLVRLVQVMMLNESN